MEPSIIRRPVAGRVAKIKLIKLMPVMKFTLIIVAIGAMVGPAVTAQKAEDPKLRVEKLTTKDGVNLNAFYFPSDKGKEAIPVLVIHEWGGQASPYGPLVQALHEAGCAVLVLDYRGHGGSDREVNEGGRMRKLDPAQMSRRDVEIIMLLDIEAAKAFLKIENNEEKLNLNALVVVGVREGCVLAANWSARDWSFPSVGRIKQGQDVKALVFVSPENTIKGVSLEPIFRNSAIMRLPILIVVGGGSPEASEAERMGKRIEITKRKFGRGSVTGYEMKAIPTSLSAASLVGEVKEVPAAIAKFIIEQVPVDDSLTPWIQRE